MLGASANSPVANSPVANSPDRVANDPVRPWREFLEVELDCPVRVVYTRARRTPIQVRPTRTAPGRTRRGIELRMHAMFAAAPPEIHKAVATWIRSGDRAPRACRILDDWIQQGLARVPAPIARKVLSGRGRCHDLDAMLVELLRTDFAADSSLRERPPRLTWGRRGGSRTRGSLRLGSYDSDTHVVRIHAVLDQAAVPDWFVRYVVFHECLHAIHPPRRGSDGRWIHHGVEFRKRENAYADHQRVLAWERAHLRALVRSARRGEPLPFSPDAGAAAKRPDIATRSAAETSTVRPALASSPIAARLGPLPAAVRFVQSLLFGD